MASGIVKWFNEKKGFGFIESEGKDYFVHYSSIRGPGFKNLTEGQDVEFKSGNGPKGPTADDVVVL